MMLELVRAFLRRAKHLPGRVKGLPGPARAMVLLAGVLCYGTTGFLYFELPAKGELRWSDALWWSAVTLTTVGYGDVFPTTDGGRYLVAVPLMVIGIGLLGYVLSLAASALIEARGRELAGFSRMKLSGHLVVVNFPNLDKVERLLDELRHDSALGVGVAVVLVDEDLQELPPELVARGVRYVRGNPSRDETLTRACIDDCGQAVVLCKRPGDSHADDQNLAIALAIEARQRKVRTVVECVDRSHEELFRKAGCDSIVCTARFDAHFIGSELLNPGTQDVVDELLSCLKGQQLYFTRVEVDGQPRYEDLAARCRARGHLAIGVRRGANVELNVPDGTRVRAGDEVVTIGPSRMQPLRAGDG